MQQKKDLIINGESVCKINAPIVAIDTLKKVQSKVEIPGYGDFHINGFQEEYREKLKNAVIMAQVMGYEVNIHGIKKRKRNVLEENIEYITFNFRSMEKANIWFQIITVDHVIKRVYYEVISSEVNLMEDLEYDVTIIDQLIEDL